MKFGILTATLFFLVIGCGIKPGDKNTQEAKPSKVTDPDPTAIAGPATIHPSDRQTKFTVNLQMEKVEQLGTEAIVSYNDVKPILDRACIGCHYEEEDFDLTAFPFESINWTNQDELINRMIEVVNSPDENIRMPYFQDPLPAKDIQILEKWREDGLLASPPGGIDEMIDRAEMVVTWKDKTKTFPLKKAKESGLYTFVEKEFPGYCDTMVFKVYKGKDMVNQLRFDDYNAMGNARLNVRMNLK